MSQDDLKTRLMIKAEATIDKILAEKSAGEDITLREIEELALSGGKDFREAVLSQLVEEGQASEVKKMENCPECGTSMHYKGKRTKPLVTEAGEVRMERDYYYCAACKRGVFPPG